VCYPLVYNWGLGIGDWGLGIGDWGLVKTILLFSSFFFILTPDSVTPDSVTPDSVTPVIESSANIHYITF
jgi:hypothetical protein